MYVHQSQIVGHDMGVGQHLIFKRQKLSLERGVGGLLLQVGYHLSQALHHCHLDGGAQFPPTIWQPKGLAASHRGRQVEICHKV